MANGERRVDPISRRRRLKVGGASVGLAPLVAWVLSEYGGVKNMPNEVAMTIGSLIGSVLSVVAFCFSDLRALILSYWQKRLGMDRRGK